MEKKEMGEFEARSEVKPAVAVPIERKKPTGLICSVVILAILVAGLAGYIVFDLTSRANSDDKTKCATTSTEKGIDGAQKSGDEQISGKKTGFVYDNYYTGSFFVTDKGDVYFKPVCYEGFGFHEGFGFYLECKGMYESYDFVAGQEPGEYGEYTLDPATLDDYHAYGQDNTVGVKFKGYKLDLNRIVYAEDIDFGQQKNASYTVLIDEDGNVNILVITQLGTDHMPIKKARAKLFKNIEKYRGAVAIQHADVGEANDSYFVMSDGSKMSFTKNSYFEFEKNEFEF